MWLKRCLPLLGLFVLAPASADLDISALISSTKPRALAEPTQRAHAGDAQAQFEPARRLETGVEAAPDPAAAVHWYRLAAAREHADARFRLGLMYLKGRGVGRELSRAISLIRRAAEDGSAYAQFRLGLMHYLGYGVRLDYAAALRWYRRAASNGHATAMNNIGIIYGLGEGGLEPDDVSAYAWFSLSAERGDENARTNRELTEKELSEKKLESARQRTKGIPADLRPN